MITDEMVERAAEAIIRSLCDHGCDGQGCLVAARAALDAALPADEWCPIETAPKDRPILLWAPEYERLPPIYGLCQWHDSYGFCIDELREPTHWRPLPSPPKGGEK